LLIYLFNLNLVSFTFGECQMKKFILLIVIPLIISACSEDDTTLGGSTNVEFTAVGSKTYVYTTIPGMGDISSEPVVTENRKGNVVVEGRITTSIDFIRKLDSLFGTAQLPKPLKDALREKAIRHFAAKIDSSDLNNIKIDYKIKAKVTSEGMQDYIHSEGDESKPFLLVKYNAKVGDKYTFKDKDGNKFVREVTYRSKTDDFEIAFWLIKVIKVEETVSDGPLKDLFGKVIYYTNHQFGLVGVEWESPDKSRKLKLTIFPSNLN